MRVGRNYGFFRIDKGCFRIVLACFRRFTRGASGGIAGESLVISLQAMARFRLTRLSNKRQDARDVTPLLDPCIVNAKKF